MAKCRYCEQEVSVPHTCRVTGKTYDQSGEFLISAVIAAATDSALLGGLLGGDIVGGIVGDMLDGDLWD